MRRASYVLPLFALLIAASGCDLHSPDASPPSSQWSVSGLQGRDIWELKTIDQRLYAATDSGVYRRSLSRGSNWVMDGVADKWVIDITWRSDGSLLAGIRSPGENSANSPVLYKRGPAPGTPWVSFDEGYGPEGARTVRALAAVPGARDTLFARGSLHVARSTDGGRHWTSVWGDWGQIGYQAPLLSVSPHDPSLVFAGGENSGFQPYLIRSPDRGGTWTHAGPLLEEGDNAVYSMIEHPKKPGSFLLGLEGHVLRSRDGGRTWTSKYEPPKYTYVFDFAAHSTPDHTVIYAAGSENGTQAGPLTLHRTTDFGNHWQRVVHHSGPDSTAVRALAYVEGSTQGRLYLGTLNGVYVYHP